MFFANIELIEKKGHKIQKLSRNNVESPIFWLYRTMAMNKMINKSQYTLPC